MHAGTVSAFLCLGLLAAGSRFSDAAAADDAASETRQPRHAIFELEHASSEVRLVADWVVRAGDNHATGNRSVPFVVVDKKNAKVFVFNAEGRLRGAAPALLGQGRGDTAVAGIGERALSQIRPEERTTPAGRFVAALGDITHGDDVLWVDYAGGVAMHRVVTTNPREYRLQRLATPTPLDNRITYGCINIPSKFYDEIVRPAFTGTDGVVYVLPEVRAIRDVFAMHDTEGAAR